MSSLRVTQRQIGEGTLVNLQGSLARVGKLQQQLSSGRLVTKPSDDPRGTVSAMQLRSEIRSNEQWARNASDGIAMLETADTTLRSSLDSLRRIRDLTLRGSNTGALPGQAREALAAEVLQLRDHLLTLANTTHNGRPVFGGVTAGRVAYNPDGTYAGAPLASTVPVERSVGDGVRVRVDVTGREVFGDSDATNVFSIVDSIGGNLLADPDALGADLGRLDGAMERIQSALATVGATYGRVEQMRTAAEDRMVAVKSSLAEVESIDLPKTILELQMQQVAYEAALGASKRVLTPSLVDFLR